MRKTFFLGLVRYLAAAAAVLSLYLLLPAGTADVPFASVCEAVTAQAALTDTAQADDQMVRRLYALDPADYESVLLLYPASSMGAEELCLVRVRDESQLEAVQAAMQTRLDAQTNVFAGYAPEQYDLCVNKSAVMTAGMDVMLVISAQKDAAAAAFTRAHDGGKRIWR